ncbi:MAG: hypothetical protein JWP12_3453 [Bacteroidetes bacterium]|nr:hypothetical protein [Bacteroidota bacterium]
MKKNSIKLFSALALLAFATFLYTGCKKEEKKPTDYSSATDNANADNAFAGIWKQISTVTDSSNTLRSTASSGCSTASITPFDLTTWPKTVVMTFGTATTNCLGSDGVNRRGTITAVFSGPYQDSATVITVTLSNYYHNDYHVEGTQTIKNMGHNSAGHLVFNVIVSGATVTNPAGTAHSTWNTNQNREFAAGYNTNFNIFDDVYLITGNANGVSSSGEAYTIVTNSPLRVNVGCPWIVSGSFTLTMADYPTYPIVFDYGAGTCDATATALLNGTTYTIYLY